MLGVPIRYQHKVILSFKNKHIVTVNYIKSYKKMGSKHTASHLFIGQMISSTLTTQGIAFLLSPEQLVNMLHPDFDSYFHRANGKPTKAPPKIRRSNAVRIETTNHSHGPGAVLHRSTLLFLTTNYSSLRKIRL